MRTRPGPMVQPSGVWRSDDEKCSGAEDEQQQRPAADHGVLRNRKVPHATPGRFPLRPRKPRENMSGVSELPIADAAVGLDVEALESEPAIDRMLVDAAGRPAEIRPRGMACIEVAAQDDCDDRDCPHHIAGIIGDPHRRAQSRACMLLFSGPLTLAEIGALLGLSRERIRQLETDILAKLRARCGINWADMAPETPPWAPGVYAESSGETPEQSASRQRRRSNRRRGRQ
jgi:hypothetical protein